MRGYLRAILRTLPCRVRVLCAWLDAAAVFLLVLALGMGLCVCGLLASGSR